MSDDNAGFSLVEGLIIAVVVVVIGVAGWLAWHAYGYRTYTDAARVYQLRYPADWTVSEGASYNDMGSPVDKNNPTFFPNDAAGKGACDTAGPCHNNGNGMNVQAYKASSPTGAGLTKQNGWYPLKRETINGYEAYYYHSSKDRHWYSYFVFHNGVLLEFDFDSCASSGGISICNNDSAHIPSFSSLVHTVKFLN